MKLKTYEKLITVNIDNSCVISVDNSEYCIRWKDEIELHNAVQKVLRFKI